MTQSLTKSARPLVLSISLIGTPAWSGDQREHVNDDLPMEEVAVTGSRIARRDFISPSPVVTLDAGDITLAGTTNVDDLLNTMPQFIADAGRSDPEGTRARPRPWRSRARSR